MPRADAPYAPDRQRPQLDLAGAPVLVTGASGFIGSAVARALARRGARLRLLVRPTSPQTNIAALGADLAVGDMRDPDAVRGALDGCRYLFHVAADYRLWARDPEEIVRNNVEGARAVVAAAAAAGVERMVYTSSVATLALRSDGAPADEDTPLQESEAIGAYKRSKVAAERIVERAVEGGLPAVIVNPSTPVGPHDVRPTPTGRIIVEAASGRMPAFVDTGLNLVHVDDVAEGHLLALEKGRVGERYILGGQDVSLREILAAIAELTGRRAPGLSLPIRPLYPLAEAAEFVGRITGREPFLTKDALTMAGHHMYFSSSKAERELGYAARPQREGLRDALEWFRTQGYVR
jgi:dihydroflavonol-4-reductase